MNIHSLMRFGVFFALLASISPVFAAGEGGNQSGIQRLTEPYMPQPEMNFFIDRQQVTKDPVVAERSNLVEFGVNKAKDHAFPALTDTSLRDVLRSMVPSSYNIRASSCVPMQAPLSAAASNNWTDALNRLGQAENLNMTIDHNSHEVVVIKTAAVNPNEKRTWYIFRSDSTIKRALERWTDPSCVSLQWDVPYAMSADADVIYPDMTLWEALQAFAKDMEGSNSPVRVTQSRNNSVRVFSDSSR